MKKKVALLLAFALLFSCFCSGNSVLAAQQKPKPKLNVKKLNMTVGSTFQIRVYNMKRKQKVAYTASKPDIVTIKADSPNSKRATITAFSVGSTTIAATVRKGKKIIRTLKCRVKVSPNAVGIKFMKREAQVHLGDKIRLETSIKPITSEEKPVFTSQDSSIATVNSRGIVTGISPGTVTITATLLSCDLSTSCTITVLPADSTGAKFQRNTVKGINDKIEKKMSNQL